LRGDQALQGSQLGNHFGCTSTYFSTQATGGGPDCFLGPPPKLRTPGKAIVVATASRQIGLLSWHGRGKHNKEDDGSVSVWLESPHDERGERRRRSGASPGGRLRPLQPARRPRG